MYTVVADSRDGARELSVVDSPVLDSRQQATEGQSQSVRLPDARGATAVQRSRLVGYVDKIRRGEPYPQGMIPADLQSRSNGGQDRGTRRH